MTKLARIVLIGLSLLMVSLQTVIGEDTGGGTGGITVLPGANGSSGSAKWSGPPRASYEFPAGQTVVFRLPANMPVAIATVHLEGSVGGEVASIVFGLLTLSGSELAQLHAAGVDRFRISLVGPELQHLQLIIQYAANGDVTVLVY